LIGDLKDRAGDVANIALDTLIGGQTGLHPLVVERGEFHGVNIPQGISDE
jgi:hypothetical protein